MKTIEKIKEYSWAIIMIFLLLLFFRQCGINRDISKIQKNARETVFLVDSTHKSVEAISTITNDDIRNQMEYVMFQFLIYEHDLDKGRITLSDIKTRMDKNEK